MKPKKNEEIPLKNPLIETKLPDSFKAVTVVQQNYLSCHAYEITVENGQIVEAKLINNAPDVMAIVNGHCQRKLWEYLKEQKSKDYV